MRTVIVFGHRDARARRMESSCYTPVSSRPSPYAPNIEPKVWTAAELERMSPPERKVIFDASVVTDVDGAAPELLERTRARVEQLIAESQSPQRG